MYMDFQNLFGTFWKEHLNALRALNMWKGLHTMLFACYFSFWVFLESDQLQEH